LKNNNRSEISQRSEISLDTGLPGGINKAPGPDCLC